MTGLVLLTLLTIFIINEVRIAIYNLYFHPLRKFPGPKSWIAFPVLRYISGCRGDFDKHLVRYHEQYGEVVRFSNDSLSFTTAQAWKDIYGYGHGQKQWSKQEFRPPGSEHNILFSDDEHHARFRKALAHSFSEQSLQLQEGLIKRYIDSMVFALRDEAEHNRVVDMTMWYNLTAFDIISDLAFGKSSNCLQTKAYTPYIVTIFKFVQLSPYIRLGVFYPTVWKLFGLLMGSRVKKSQAALQQIGANAVAERKADRSKDGRGDFMEGLLKHSEEKELITDTQLNENATMLFMAGSETSATALAGVTYYMLKHPSTMAKAVEEVRSAFVREEDITFASASAKLPYMLACLEEGLRVYPATPSVLVRTVPEPSTVSGYAIPPNTHVGVHQLATNHSKTNFHDADAFRPERWLPEAQKADSPYLNDNREARQPFSVGPRNCIGKNLAFSEMRQILARVLWNFDLDLVDRQQKWDDQRAFLLRSKGPLMCRIKERVL